VCLREAFNDIRVRFMHGFIVALDEEIKMSRRLFAPTLVLLVLAGASGTGMAQVKRVQMHIAGYLCGN
jgi:hypothetical protein